LFRASSSRTVIFSPTPRTRSWYTFNSSMYNWQYISVLIFPLPYSKTCPQVAQWELPNSDLQQL
jgi:hypothetical protein